MSLPPPEFWNKSWLKLAVGVLGLLLIGLGLSQLAFCRWAVPSGREGLKGGPAPNQLHNDFAHYYVSSQLVLESSKPYQESFQTRFEDLGLYYDKHIPSATNPPPLLWLFAPLTLLPLEPAYWVWAAIQLIALAVHLYVVQRLLGLTWASGWTAILWGTTIVAGPVYWHFYYSQVQLLLSALIGVAFLCHTRQRRLLACTLISFAGVIKLFPFLILPWFVLAPAYQSESEDPRRMSNIGRRFIMVLLVMTVLLLATGPRLWIGFSTDAMKVIQDNAVKQFFNYSIPSVIRNVAFVANGSQLPPEDGQLWSRLGTLSGLAIVATMYWVFWRYPKIDQTLQFALLILAMLLGSPTAWGHYLIFLTLPIALLLKRAVQERNLLETVIILVCLLPIALVHPTPWLFFRGYRLLTFQMLFLLTNLWPTYAMVVLLLLGLKRALPKRRRKRKKQAPHKRKPGR